MPSATVRTAAIIKQKLAYYIQEFAKLRAEKGKHLIQNKAECIGMCPDEEIK